MMTSPQKKASFAEGSEVAGAVEAIAVEAIAVAGAAAAPALLASRKPLARSIVSPFP